MITHHLFAIVIAILLDRIVGDPKSNVHPVVLIGKLISLFERLFNRGERKRLKGVVMLVLVTTIVFLITFAVVSFAYSIHPFLGIIVEAIGIASAIAVRSLKEAAEAVYVPLSNGEIVHAREKLSHIVGRDTERLTEEEIVRATVETVAENTSDGVTSPLFYAFFGGAPLAIVYRAVNTCDSMVGYTNEKYAQFGWASARCDDLLNFIPSRLTAFLTILIHSKRDRFDRWRTVKKEAVKHLSPNSGWNEAAVATILNVQLGGPSTYEGIVVERATIGNGNQRLEIKHILDAISIMIKTVIAFVCMLCIVGGVILVVT